MLKCKDQNLICPVCGFEYVHITKVQAQPVGPGMHCVTATGRGVNVSTLSRPGGLGRGNDVVLTFQCECSHEFTYTFGFHKGQTPFELKVRELESVDEFCGTLWRD